jgi:hypothetical protein
VRCVANQTVFQQHKIRYAVCKICEQLHTCHCMSGSSSWNVGRYNDIIRHWRNWNELATASWQRQRTRNPDPDLLGTGGIGGTDSLRGGGCAVPGCSWHLVSVSAPRSTLHDVRCHALSLGAGWVLGTPGIAPGPRPPRPHLRKKVGSKT